METKRKLSDKLMYAAKILGLCWLFFVALVVFNLIITALTGRTFDLPLWMDSLGILGLLVIIFGVVAAFLRYT